MSSHPSHSDNTSRVVRRLLAVGSDELDEALRDAIRFAAQLAGVEHSLIVVSTRGQIEVLATSDDDREAYEERVANWVGKGLATARQFPVLADCFIRGEVVHVPDVDALPKSADLERERFQHYGVESFLGIPIRSEARVSGIQVFASVGRKRRWGTEDVAALQLIAETIGIALDRRGAEDALRDSEARFRALTEHATELIAELDTRGVYRYVSPSSRELLGYEPEELVGRQSGDFVHPDDLASSKLRLGRAFGSESESHVVHRVRHRDGSWRWFDNTGRAFRNQRGEIRFVSVGRDISERRRTEEDFARRVNLEVHLASLSRRFLDVRPEEAADAIRLALQQTAAVVGADRAYVVSYLPISGKGAEIFTWNTDLQANSFERMPWITPRLLAGRVVHVPKVSELPDEASRECERFQSRGTKSLVGIPLLSSGKILAYLSFERTVSEEPFTEEQINALGVIGQIFVSTLRRRRSQEQLSETHAHLAQSQKIEAVGRLAGGIAHDFNNLLTVILGFARPLMRDLENRSAKHDVGQIVDAAERAASLTGQLLSFSRRQSSDAQPIDLNRVIAGLEPMLGRLLEEDVRLAFDLCEGPCIIAADPHQIEQVLVNLAVNARDAMPGGGDLTVRTRVAAVDEATHRSLGLEGPGEYIVLDVTDTGTGMTPEAREHSLEPFYTTKEQGKGTGLGLSIAYGVVRQARGSIHIDSKPDVGTTIRIHLPRTSELSIAPTQLAEMAARNSGGRILLVEDENAVRSLVRRLLENAGYEVIEAGDGVEAMQRFRQSDAIDVLVTDVVMPRMGGFELARLLRAELPDLPVLYVSGYPEPRNASNDLETPEGVFVFKPFRPERLLSCLAEILEDSANTTAARSAG